MVRAPSVGSGVTVLTKVPFSPGGRAERALLAVLAKVGSGECRGGADVLSSAACGSTSVMRAVVELATPARRQAMPQLGPVLQGGI